MDKNTQQQASWEYFDGTWHVGVDGERENYEMFGYPTRDLHTATPAPRDVLMAALGELDDWIVDESGLGIPYRVREEIADRYASQVQPERCQCCGYSVTESEHKGCLRAGRAAIQPEPVNQLLAALEQCYSQLRKLEVKDGGVCSALNASADAIAAAEKEQGHD